MHEHMWRFSVCECTWNRVAKTNLSTIHQCNKYQIIHIKMTIIQLQVYSYVNFLRYKFRFPKNKYIIFRILMCTISLFIDNFFFGIIWLQVYCLFSFSFIFLEDITITVAHHSLSLNNIRVLNFCSTPKPWNRTRDILRIYN